MHFGLALIYLGLICRLIVVTNIKPIRQISTRLSKVIITYKEFVQYGFVLDHGQKVKVKSGRYMSWYLSHKVTNNVQVCTNSYHTQQLYTTDKEKTRSQSSRTSHKQNFKTEHITQKKMMINQKCVYSNNQFFQYHMICNGNRQFFSACYLEGSLQQGLLQNFTK